MGEFLQQAAEFLRGSAIGVGLGLAIGGLALALPFRRLGGRRELGWDVLAAIASTGFATWAEAMLDVPADVVMARLEGWYASSAGLSGWLVVPVYVILADFCAYWAHRALHTRWLWSTHAWHHSTEHLYWISGQRGSPIHALVLSAPYYVAFILFPVSEATVAAGVMFVLDTSNQHYIHSNLKIPFAKKIERLFVTPRFHFVHHSATPKVSNSNYGFIFSVWDRWFGTYTDPDVVPPDDPLGLSYEISSWRLVLGLPQRASPKVRTTVVPHA